MKNQISLAFAVIALSLIPFFAKAGGHFVGNGGVVWACVSGANNEHFHGGFLTDLYEARKQYNWTVVNDPGGDPISFYQARKAWLAANLPDFYRALKPRFEYVEQHMSIVDAFLISTQDFNPAIRPYPQECPQGRWETVNIANFREEDQLVMIQKMLWESPLIATIDKSALLFHEAVYYWMRTFFGATNSDKSRKITGLLFTSKSPEEMKNEIRSILGTYPDQPDGKFLCTIKNTKRNQLYVAYDDNQKNAERLARQRCQEESDPQFCSRGTLECAEITANENRVCSAENGSTRIMYTGKGRNLLEAQFNAHLSCYMGSQTLKKPTQTCPEFAFMECE